MSLLNTIYAILEKHLPALEKDIQSIFDDLLETAERQGTVSAAEVRTAVTAMKTRFASVSTTP